MPSFIPLINASFRSRKWGALPNLAPIIFMMSMYLEPPLPSQRSKMACATSFWHSFLPIRFGMLRWWFGSCMRCALDFIQFYKTSLPLPPSDSFSHFSFFGNYGETQAIGCDCGEPNKHSKQPRKNWKAVTWVTGLWLVAPWQWALQLLRTTKSAKTRTS